MATSKQELGILGETIVVKKCSCPRCKRSKTLRRLPTNFKCADVICDFCGYLAQVKTSRKHDIDSVPKMIPGAAWQPQKERMESSIYFPLFLVLIAKHNRRYSVFYLSGDLQKPEIFRPRKPLSSSAKRKGWRGFSYELTAVRESFVRLR